MFKFYSQRSNYGESKTAQISFAPGVLRLPSGGWVADALAQSAAQSKAMPVESRTVGNLRRGLAAASKSTSWVQAAALRPESVSLVEAVGAFQALESAIEKYAAGGEANKYALSAAVRRLLREYLVDRRAKGVNRLHVAFRTQFQSRQPPRPLISDGASGAYPLGATPHTSRASLDEALTDRFRLTRSRLEDPCELELDRFFSQRQAVDQFFSAKPDERLIANLLSVNGKLISQSQCFPKWLSEAPAADLLAAYYAILVRHRPMHSSTFACVRTVELSGLLADLLGTSRPSKPTDLLRQLGHLRIGTADAMVAAVICLQFASGWNVSSVLEVTESDIKEEGDFLLMQGFKSKTGDFTPPVYLSQAEHLALKALAFLRERLTWLKAVGWVDSDENRLWLSPLKLRRGSPAQYAGWSKMLRDFIDKHGLPRFTFEQLRDEVIAREAVSVGGLEAARRIAGHRSEILTGEYLDQLLLHRRSSSINLEFQRRVERSVTYRLTETPEFFDEDLLYPVGDGTSCVDPLHPPADRASPDGTCSARLCHSEEGCPNNKLVIDAQRIEEVARLSSFYAHNWKRLLAENAARFNRYDLPAMRFNFALRSVIAQGPMRLQLTRVERQISEESR
ncbi:MAG: hypothetical protein V4684_04375 [Pseudomonadota bacterium]